MGDAIFKAVFVVGLLVYLFGVFGPHRRRSRMARIREERGTKVNALLSVLAAVGMYFVPLLYVLTSWPRFADYQLPVWTGVLGAVALAAALWLTWKAHADLGRNWSETLQIKEEHALVTRGVYRHVRHPIYAAQWLWGIGQALLLHNWIGGLAGLVSFLPVYLYRVPHEEQMMRDHFGEEYRQYAKRTGRIIPPLRR